LIQGKSTESGRDLSMTETAAEADQPDGLFHTLRAQHDELRRQVAASGEEIDQLQVEVAKNKRNWYRNPSVLIATLALVVSAVTFGADQFDVYSGHQRENRTRLSSLIEQLPTDQAQNPTIAGNLVSLHADSALVLMDQLGPGASTASEKIQVADALVKTYDLPNGKRLAVAAEQQATTVHEKAIAEQIIADIDFQTGDAASGRGLYRRIISLFQTPQKEADSSALRNLQTANVELAWAGDEITLARNCQGGIEQLQNAKRVLDLLPQDRVTAQTTALNNEIKVVNASCPTSVG
jgi:hypothetical protein